MPVIPVIFNERQRQIAWYHFLLSNYAPHYYHNVLVPQIETEGGTIPPPYFK